MGVVHWDPLRKRDRGLGENLLNLSGKIHDVDDLDRSITFYRDILQFKMLKRDKTSATFDCKNMVITIKAGTPITFSGDNLIVSHVSVDVVDIANAFEYLYSQKVHFEINVSVSTGGGLGFAEGGGLEHTVGQAFLRDPDGYYFEICNCHLLTDFVLKKKTDFNPDVYHEGNLVVDKKRFFQHTLRFAGKLIALANKAKANVASMTFDSEVYFGEPLPPDKWPKEVDSKVLNNFIKRKKIYSAITQSFSDEELKEIILQAGNHAPTAIKLMQRKIASGKVSRVYQPPAYFVQKITVDENGKVRESGTSFQPKALVAGEEEKGKDQNAPKETCGYKTKIIQGTQNLSMMGKSNVEKENLSIVEVNHIGIIVSNVGAATDFCACVLGLQQVRRPNFDRHGAWFTGGNLEIHLILGNPLVPDCNIKGPNANCISLMVKDLDLAKEVLAEKNTADASIMLEVCDDACFVRDPDGYVYKIHE